MTEEIYLLKDSFEVAQEIIAKIWLLVSEEIYDKEITLRSPTYALKEVLIVLLSTVECQYFRRDSPNDSFPEESSEPIAPPIDSWARNAIPTSKKLPAKLLSPISLSKAYASSKDSALQSRSQKNPGLKIQPVNLVNIEEFKPIPLFDPIQDFDEKEEFLRCIKERQMKIKQDAHDRVIELRAQEKQRRKLIMKDFNGVVPNFTHDSNGKVILITEFANPKTTDMDEINYKLINQEFKYNHISPEPQIYPEIDFKSTPAENLRKPKKLEPIQTHFHELYTENILNHLRLSPGVTLISPAENKSSHFLAKGDTIKNIKKHQTEKLINTQKLFNKFNTKQLASTNLLETVPELTSLSPRNTNFKGKMKFSSTREYKKSVKNVVKTPKDIKMAKELSPIDAFNLNIFTDKTWGMNPSYQEVKQPYKLPKTPTSKDMWELFGHIVTKNKDNMFTSTEELMPLTDRVKKPKDRPFIERKIKKTRQPPPPFGQTMSTV